MRPATARAAMRRGSSIKIFCPPSQELVRRKSGTMVLLPAPGGASNSTLRRLARASASAGSASLIGKSGNDGGLTSSPRITQGGQGRRGARAVAGPQARRARVGGVAAPGFRSW